MAKNLSPLQNTAPGKHPASSKTDNSGSASDTHAPGSHTIADEAKTVWGIAWPLILTNILNVLVGVIDFKMVGALGVAPIAAVGMARQVMQLVFVIMIAISGGTSVIIARAYGSGDTERVGIITARSIFFMLGTAVFLVMPIGFFLSGRFLAGLGGSDEVVALGNSYLQIIFLGSIVTMFNFAVTGALLGVGKTKVSLILLIGVNGLNILFNYGFIFGVGPIPAFGVRGAAMGTVLARSIGMLAGIWITRNPRFLLKARYREGLSLDFNLFGQILKLGGPRSLQGVVRNFSRLLTIRIITLLPHATRAVSAYSVGMQVRMISTFVGLAFMSAALARVGYNMGADDPKRAEQSGWIASGMAAVCMSVFALLFLVIPEAIIGFFTDDPGVIELGRTFFIIIALSEPVMAFALSIGGALRGGGDSISPFIYSSISDLVVVIAAGYLLAIPLGFGFSGVAIGIAVSALTRAIPTLIIFRKGRWKKITLL